ncbi:hypothetical protein [Kiritimatiella glycovorans]|uniref:Type 4 fimbrial biogenesis protein PilX N-terminal domain-containing protein n=1 Tax=Kiritimatiella glycovorans TaxID=1307763 RepID=A0A0G3EAP8_9BACT|nr:hypothetical protein [Kiritimatiella glycovorans]AKJ63556.1 hypothetical protein L21SP4_00275 [Kiritimatiella glycovorans]
MKTERSSEQGGFVLAAVLLLLFVISIAAAAIAVSGINSVQVARRFQESDQCLLAAQSMLEEVKEGVYENFRDYYINQNHVLISFNWFTSGSDEWIGSPSAFKYDIPNPMGYGVYTGSVEFLNEPYSVVTPTPDDGTRYVEITLRAEASNGRVTRAVQETLRYGMTKSRIFDFAYFLNNHGWFYGVNCVVNGGLRSNRDMELRSTGLVLNGDCYAVGQTYVQQNYQIWDQAYYWNHAPDQARPTRYPSSSATDAWPMGYDSQDQSIYSGAEEIPMPYLGDLSLYTNYAQLSGGTIEQGTNVLVDAVYDGPGFNTNDYATADDGCLVLQGTPSNPIEINGAVVVEGDLIIGGTVTGQGTIYAGRNIHVINEVEYADPPEWVKPDSDPETTAVLNRGKDFLGLAAKGCVIYGDYTRSDFSAGWIQQYMRPPFTQPYITDATDADIGFCTSYDGTNYWFDGDYTEDFGEKLDSDNPSNGVPRAYFESSLSDDDFKSLNPDRYIGRLDAAIFNNHLTAGRFSSNCELNGSMTCRDECLIPNGRIYINWDIRLGHASRDGTDFNSYLPRGLNYPELVSWREVAP